jgi:hypothetical protein
MGDMNVSVVRQWLAGLAMIPLLAGLAFAAGGRSFVCPGDSVARLECCCPGHGPRPLDRRARFDTACYCDVHQVTAPIVPAVSPARDATGFHSVCPPAVVSTLGSKDAVRPLWEFLIAARTQHPPPQSVPILLQRQSFLL